MRPQKGLTIEQMREIREQTQQEIERLEADKKALFMKQKRIALILQEMTTNIEELAEEQEVLLREQKRITLQLQEITANIKELAARRIPYEDQLVEEIRNAWPTKTNSNGFVKNYRLDGGHAREGLQSYRWNDRKFIEENFNQIIAIWHMQHRGKIKQNPDGIAEERTALKQLFIELLYQRRKEAKPNPDEGAEEKEMLKRFCIALSKKPDDHHDILSSPLERKQLLEFYNLFIAELIRNKPESPLEFIENFQFLHSKPEQEIYSFLERDSSENETEDYMAFIFRGFSNYLSFLYNANKENVDKASKFSTNIINLLQAAIANGDESCKELLGFFQSKPQAGEDFKDWYEKGGIGDAFVAKILKLQPEETKYTDSHLKKELARHLHSKTHNPQELQEMSGFAANKSAAEHETTKECVLRLKQAEADLICTLIKTDPNFYRPYLPLGYDSRMIAEQLCQLTTFTLEEGNIKLVQNGKKEGWLSNVQNRLNIALDNATPDNPDTAKIFAAKENLAQALKESQELANSLIRAQRLKDPAEAAAAPRPSPEASGASGVGHNINVSTKGSTL